MTTDADDDPLPFITLLAATRNAIRLLVKDQKTDTETKQETEERAGKVPGSKFTIFRS